MKERVGKVAWVSMLVTRESYSVGSELRRMQIAVSSSIFDLHILDFAALKRIVSEVGSDGGVFIHFERVEFHPKGNSTGGSRILMIRFDLLPRLGWLVHPR
jgi:hypothetical protein